MSLKFDYAYYIKRIDELESELSLFRNAVEGANVGIWEWDLQTGEQKINERWAEICGYTIEELAPITIETFKKLIHPEDRERIHDKINETFYKEKGYYSFVFRMLHKNGQIVWVESHGAVNTWTPSGEPWLASGSHYDITQRKLTEEAIIESERRLLATQVIAHIGNWELNLATKEIWGSDEAFRIYGIERSPTNTLNGAIVNSMIAPDYREKTDRALDDLIVKGELYDIQYQVVNGITQETVLIHSRAKLQFDSSGEPFSVIGTIQDITESHQREEELWFLGFHDILTGLYNRRYFNRSLQDVDIHENLPITIMLCDVNGLKLVNDCFGHDLGDELLKHMANSLRESCRSEDLICRYGGDEFAIILPNTTEDEASELIDRFKETILGKKIGAFDVSVSFGYSTKKKQKQNLHVIVKEAEDDMFRHKLYTTESIRSKTVDLIMNTLYEKNNREMLHSKRVSQLCESLAIKMGRSKEDINKVRIGGLLHDIGKIGIDENILNKAGPLDKEEWSEIKKHSHIGYRILSAASEFSEIAEYVLAHQERWDGSGYPRGLKSDEISIESRIIAIADAYDAMTGVRTYGKEFTKEEAFAELKRCAGTHFDPYLVELFIQTINE